MTDQPLPPEVLVELENLVRSALSEADDMSARQASGARLNQSDAERMRVFVRKLSKRALDTARSTEAMRAENERLTKLVYVPGLTRCAKCGLKLVSSTLNAHTGGVHANTEPQACLNGCGPMWRVTEREAGNTLCDQQDALVDRAVSAEAKLKAAREALEKIKGLECASSINPRYSLSNAVAIASAFLSTIIPTGAEDV